MIVRQLAFHPSLPNSNHLNTSTKAVLPASFIDDVTGSTPQVLEISTPGCIKHAYVTAQEYTSDMIVYLPSALMQDCFIRDGEEVEITRSFPPPITELHLNVPPGFLDSVWNPKEELERVITEKYQVLQQGETISIGPWDLDVIKTEPAEVVTTHDTDPEVIFINPPLPIVTPASPPPQPRVPAPRPRQRRDFSTRRQAKKFAGVGRSLS